MNRNFYLKNDYLLFILSVTIGLLLTSSFVYAQDDLPTYNMTDALVTDCEGILYDSGGAEGTYDFNENFTFTICPESDDAIACIAIDVISSNLENNFDLLSFYDGVEADPNTLIATYSGDFPPLIEATSGCVTLVFTSDDSVVQNGWEFQWRCSQEACPPIPVSVQDCIGAIPICRNQYFETNAYQGIGFIANEINALNSCLNSGEKNNVWYVFTVQEAGMLNFSILPNNLSDDYDWSVFNLTNHECSDIFQLAELEVSCSFSGEPGVTGPNGLEGNQNQPTLAVSARETYLINVSQFSDNSDEGYTIDFEASSAVIFDDVAPVFQAVETPNCGESLLNIRFSENILCGSVDASDFELIGPGGPYTLSLATEICISNPNAYENNYQLQVSPPLSIGGEYGISFIGTIADVCENSASNTGETLNFSIDVVNFQGIVDDLILCENEEAIITIEGENTYHFYTSDGVAPSNLLTVGNTYNADSLLSFGQAYTLIITQIDGLCESEPIVVTITKSHTDLAGFTYGFTQICVAENRENPIPIFPSDVETNGIFSINNNGVINESTGEIDLANTPTGVYTISFLSAGNCPTTVMETIVLTANSNSDFSIINFICKNENAPNPIPQLAENATLGGTFSIDNNGIINENTGEIDLANTAMGTYNITYSVEGDCPSNSSQDIEIRDADISDFSIPNLVCKNGIAPIPLIADGMETAMFSISEGGVINPLIGEIDLENTPVGDYIITYTSTGDCPSSTSHPIRIAPAPSPILLFPLSACVTGTELFSFFIEMDVADETAQHRIFIDGFIDTILVGTIVLEVQLPGDGISTYELIITNTTTNCSTSENIEAILCEAQIPCNGTANAGTMSSDLQIVCFGENISGSATNIFLEEGMISSYLLHDNATETLGNVLGYISNGVFNASEIPDISFNTTYYISSFVGFDENGDGRPDFNNPCTLLAAGTPIVFLAPIQIEADDNCDRTSGRFSVTFSVSGGFPAYDRTASYQVSGSFSGALAFEERVTVGPFAGGEGFILEVNDDLNCKEDLFVELVECNKSPIELLYFKGDIAEKGNLISWATASEIDNDFFTLKRSTDGTHFTNIAQISGIGNSTQTQAYEYIDNFSATNIVYYQLLQSDFNGQISNHGVIALQAKNKVVKSNIRILPSTQQSILSIHITAAQAEKSQISIYDIQGKKVAHQNIKSKEGVYTFYTSDYPSAMYFVVLQDGTHTISQKWVKR